MLHPPYAPTASPRRPATAPPAARPRREKWGWLEWFVVSQTFLPALLFVPGISSGRSIIKVVQMLVPVIAWVQISQSGRREVGRSAFPARPWLVALSGLLGLLIFHWNTNNIPSGLAHAMIYIAVFSPAFWATKALRSPAQLGRLAAILLVCNGISALVGLGQVFRPGTFNPPVIPGVTDLPEDSPFRDALVYKDGSGQSIIRPCGLSDQVGSAAGAGVFSTLLGLAFALRRIGTIRRLACLGIAFVGVAVIYYSQVRTNLLMLVFSIIALTMIFVAQKNYAHATLLGGLGVAMIVGAFAWVAATSGDVVVRRFLGLLDSDVKGTLDKSGRSAFVMNALEVRLWSEPAGEGLGWWTTAYTLLGNKARAGGVWIEVMISGWVHDGGLPMIILYPGALAAALGSSIWVALRARDKDVGFWAAVVFAANLSVVATTFSWVPFVTAIGIQFWLLAAVVHAADARSRLPASRPSASRPSPAGSPGPRPTLPQGPPPYRAPA